MTSTLFGCRRHPERMFIEIMTSDRKLKASREGPTESERLDDTRCTTSQRRINYRTDALTSRRYWAGSERSQAEAHSRDTYPESYISDGGTHRVAIALPVRTFRICSKERLYSG